MIFPSVRMASGFVYDYFVYIPYEAEYDNQNSCKCKYIIKYAGQIHSRYPLSYDRHSIAGKGAVWRKIRKNS